MALERREVRLMDWLQTIYALSVPLFMLGGCPCCLFCAHCDPTNSPHQTVQVVISGVVNAGCATCSVLNGTYVLTRGFGASECIWSVTFPTTCINISIIQLEVAGTASHVDITTSGGATRVKWTSTAAGFDDCGNWSSFSLPFATNTGGACDGTAATCLITAL